jgi:hypothetical protein
MCSLHFSVYSGSKVYQGEQMVASEFFTEMAIGGVTGVISGGTGAVAEVGAVSLAKEGVKQGIKVGVTKCAVRVVAGVQLVLLQTQSMQL